MLICSWWYGITLETLSYWARVLDSEEEIAGDAHVQKGRDRCL